MNILVHGTILGYGGIAHHTREFTKNLSKYHNVKIRNFNLVDLDDWRGYTGPDILKDAKHLEEVHHNMLYQQTLMDGDFKDFPLTGYDESFEPDFHLIMAEVNHYYHYDKYDKPVIIYFPWETTNILPEFLSVIKSAKYLWVPSEWQKQILINNNVNEEKISIVNEGVDPLIYFPIERHNKKLRLLHIGTWGYRKSTYEIVKSFIDVFGNDDNVEFRIAIHNKLRLQDSPEETFKKYGLPIQDNIKFLPTLSEKEYVNEIQNADLYISCSRGEGWNLPLIEALSSGVPSIYSKCGGQLEFTKNNLGIGIEIKGQYFAKRVLKINGENYYWESLKDYNPNYLYEPDYYQLKKELKLFYNSFLKNDLSYYKNKALKDSEYVRKNFNWVHIAEKASRIINNYTNVKMSNIYYLINSNSFGDTLAATPTLRYLSKSHKQKLNVVTFNKNVFDNNPYVEQCLSFDEYVQREGHIVYKSFTYPGQKDGNGIEKKFSRIDTRQLHAMDLGFQLLPEEMDYDFYPDEMSLKVDLPDEYVVLHVTTNWPNRTWNVDNWQNLINWLSENKIYTVLIGFGYREKLHSSLDKDSLEKVCPIFDNLYGLDLTNQGSISDMWWVLNGSKCLITMDSGPLHLAGCTDTEIIQLGSALNPKLRVPYRNGSQEYKYHYVGGSCNIFCNSDLFYNIREWGNINSVPPQLYCMENKPTYECHPSTDKVITVVKNILNLKDRDNSGSEKIKFGIYTSFYNCERFIDNAFFNIEKLKYNNFEWHVTDDFSSDDTKQKVLERLEKSPIKDKIKYYDQLEKKQMYWKPNLFFDETFEWIILVDADDEFDSEFLNVYNNILKDKDDVYLVSSDFFKINENDNSLHSISYVINDDIISNKIERYHPECDYLNNISYSCFGHLRGFRNQIDSFEVDDMLACAEDSYHVFWSNSYGKYLHVPRPLYKWKMRDDSESHSGGPKPNFNGNFDIALNKLKQSDYGVDTYFNDIYLETCTIGSHDFKDVKNKTVSIWTRDLTIEQKNKIRLLYSDFNILFNQNSTYLNLVCLNYFSDIQLNEVLENIGDNDVTFYYQNQKIHKNNNEKDKELEEKLNYYCNVIRKYKSFSWWIFIRHFIIKS